LPFDGLFAVVEPASGNHRHAQGGKEERLTTRRTVCAATTAPAPLRRPKASL
jgi:hypothetical protein